MFIYPLVSFACKLISNKRIAFKCHYGSHYNVNNLVVVVIFSFSLFSCNHEDERKVHLVFEMPK